MQYLNIGRNSLHSLYKKNRAYQFEGYQKKSAHFAIQEEFWRERDRQEEASIRISFWTANRGYVV